MNEEENQENKVHENKDEHGDDGSVTSITPKDASPAQPIKETCSITHSNQPPIREDLVSVAVHFLNNPRVQSSPESHKKVFLMKKGLSNDEINEALKRSEVAKTSYSQQTNNQIMPKSNGMSMSMPHQHYIPPPLLPPTYYPSFMMRTTSLASSLALISGVFYGAFLLYKQYIEPKLTGLLDLKVKKHPFVVIQEQLTQVSNMMALMQNDLKTIEDNLKKHIDSQLALLKQEHLQGMSMQEVKTELNSIKGLLLNRRQFAATPVVTIPSWQLENKSTSNENNGQQLTNGNASVNGDMNDKSDEDDSVKSNGDKDAHHDDNSNCDNSNMTKSNENISI